MEVDGEGKEAQLVYEPVDRVKADAHVKTMSEYVLAVAPRLPTNSATKCAASSRASGRRRQHEPTGWLLVVGIGRSAL